MHIKQTISRTVGILLLLLCGDFISAQNFEDYQRLRCSGEIPAELLGSTTEKYKERLRAAGRSSTEEEQASKEEFLLESSFFLDGLLRSGKVLFNDPVSEYLNRIKDFVLRENDALREKIHIYTLRSHHVNAFATNEGVILVTTGLVSHAQSEASLAFVICHEIQHYLRKHSMKRYMETAKLKERKDWESDEEALALATCRYSRDQEMEADTAGLRLYRSTGYGVQAVDQSYDLLARAEFPFDDSSRFDKRAFETENLRFPNELVLNPVEALEINEEFDDTLQTHPNVGKRRKMAASLLEAEAFPDGLLFVFGEGQFEQVRNICRFEQTADFFDAGRYEDAIFNSYLLLQDFPGNVYLRKVVAASLFNLVINRNNHDFFDVHVDYEDAGGEYQRMLFLFQEMERHVFHIMALSWTWDLLQDAPQDRYVQGIAKAMVADLYAYHDDEAKALLRENAPEGYFDAFAVYTDTLRTGEPIDEEAYLAEGYYLSDTLYQMEDSLGDESTEIDEELVEASDSTDKLDLYYQYALAEYFKQSDFDSSMSAAQAKAQARRAEENSRVNYTYGVEDPLTQRKRKIQGQNLGIDKMVVVSPSYQVMLTRKGQTRYDRVEGETRSSDFKHLILEAAQKQDLDLSLLDPATLTQSDVQEFNDIIFIKEYVSGTNRDEEINLPNFNQRIADSLIEKYHTPYFAFMFMSAHTRYRRLSMLDGLAFSATVGLATPVIAMRLLIPARRIRCLTMVMDIRDNEIMMVEYNQVKGKDSDTRLKSTIYNTLYQIKSKPKQAQ